MRKILTALCFVFATSIANAVPTINIQHPQPVVSNNPYHVGYVHGKNTAYNNVARTLFITGLVVVAGIIIYNAGEQSRWTTNEKGVVYRF